MPQSQKGFALVIVIWILTLLSLMAGSFALTMRRDSSVTASLKNTAEASAVAEGGLGLAQYMLLQPDPKQRWLADGTIYQLIRADGAKIRIRAVSELGKIDINAADENQLSAVFRAVTGDKWEQQHLVNSVLDWRDEDDQPLPHGAEKKQYKEAGLPYVPSNRAFQTLDELQLVLGMDEEIFAMIQPWLTVYSGQPEVDLKQATPEVLQILSEDLKDKNVRNEYMEQRLTAEADQNDVDAGIGENQAYTIIVEVKMDDDSSATLEAVIKIQSEDPSLPPMQVLDWKQNQLRQSLFGNEMESRLITVQDEFTNNN